MPWAVSLPQQQLILRLARGKYQGFNDSHLAGKLRAEENLSVSRETVRRILRAAKIASPQKRRPRQYRSRRPPRPRFGMMVLTDASRHNWLEGRGPHLTLVGFQDDATSQILAARFQLEPENTLGYLRVLHAMITAHGIPLNLYRDRRNIFQRNDAHWTLAEELSGKQTPTHFGRALQELGIEQTPAYSRRPRAASSVPGALVRIAWSANCAWLRPPLCCKPTPCWSSSAPIIIAVSLAPPQKPLVIFVLCHAALIWPAV
jgi:hypothetical protein